MPHFHPPNYIRNTHASICLGKNNVAATTGFPLESKISRVAFNVAPRIGNSLHDRRAPQLTVMMAYPPLVVKDQ